MSSERITPVSASEIHQRRRHLKRQRGFKSLRLTWQLLGVASLTGIAVALSRQPDWVIRQPEQVQIEGNQFISTEIVRDRLPLSYPQSLLRVNPKAIVASLESQPPIVRATARRQLFPPSLKIEIAERYPVALAYPSKAVNSTTPEVTPSGLLDEGGVLIPWESYRQLAPNLTLPALTIRGEFEEYGEFWSQVYREISRSPLQIVEIDWQDPTDLILKTELGEVRLGPYGDRFAEQLQILDRMRKLPEQIDFSQVLYIDLSDPDAPSVQMQPEDPPTAADADPNLELSEEAVDRGE
ncbi:MAG: FtsQ-type POTRA domain-containing protein [Cyanobacteriota bacterium]|nr:FtsQ-type POTRA domain-containing protein [Cyanobacteriota bacterium]